MLETLYEGQVLKGVPSGFGRTIDGRARHLFVGYFKDWTNTPDGPSLGLYFENFKLVYSGLYRGGSIDIEVPNRKDSEA